MTVNESLARNLKSAREEKGFTQEFVASQLHTSRQAISRWETGKGVPDIVNLKKLSSLYNISIDELTQNNVSHKKTEIHTSFNSATCTETLFFVLIAILSLNIPVIGILVPILIIIRMKALKKKNYFVFLVSVFCIVIEAYSIFVIINHYFLNFGSSSVQPL